MSKKFKWRSGDNWARCQRCDRIFRASELRREWTGLLVCQEDWEPRHEQDFVRARKDNFPPKVISPELTDTFVTGFCKTRSAVVGVAIVGCAIVGLDPDYNEIPSGTFNTNTL